MATTVIAASIKSIPPKEDLRKAFDAIQSYSSSLASFTLQWKGLEDHLASIERSIEDRFKQLESKSHSPALDDEPDADPRPELKALCAKMDAKGLRSYIVANRKDLAAIRCELSRSLQFAPDPAALVLDAMVGFYPPKSKSKGEKDTGLQAIRRTCVNLLEKFQAVAPEIKPSVRDRAKKLALEWKGKITDGGENALEALGFLQLLLSYGLVSEFKVDELLDLLVFVSRRKQTLDLIKSLGLTESMPDLIQKLSNKGKQLDAVKFVYAFNLLEKYPPVPLLKNYLKESKRAAQELRKKGNNSSQSQHDATSKEIAALRAIVKAIEEYKLEAEYSCENLQKRIAQLEQQKADKKRAATTVAASNLKYKQQQQLQQSNKRPRASTMTTSVSAARPFPTVVQNQSHIGFTDRPSYLGLAGSYGLTTTGSLFDRAGPGPGISGTPTVLGGNSTPAPYLYSSEFLASSALYDRPATYSGYSGLSTSFGLSLYP